LAVTSSVQRLTITQIALLAVFTLSGFAGLIYESIWTQYLKLFLGHAAYAQTLVLAIFMGGMAIGALAVGQWSRQIRRLLLGYAVVELAIGILGLLFHPVFQWFMDWSFEHAIPAVAPWGGVQLFKWLGGALLILPGSVLMGATFPLISGGLVRQAPHRSGELLALLYFTNCLGAAIGVLVSGFVLIAEFGLPGTLLTAGLLNILLAAFVWLLRKTERGPEDVGQRPAARDADRSVRWLAAAAFATGLISFLYEIAWIRMLSLVLGSSTHSFELMLAAFIFGLALGGLWIRRRIDRLKDPMRFLSSVLLLMGALAALTIAGYYYAFDVIAWAMRAFAHTESGYTGFTVVAQCVAGALMVPVTFLAGMTLPLITRLLMASGAGERAIGTVYALNTLGSILGVVAAIHLLMPAVGVKGTILVGAALHLLLGISGLRFARPVTAQFATRLLAGVSIAAVIFVALRIQPDPRRMVSAVYGKTATVALLRTGGMITIQTNGKPDAAIEMGKGPPAEDEITQIMCGALPLSLHPAPRNVAVIGIGSGLTSHVILTSAAVQSLTSIEIEPFMVDAARQAYLPRVSRLFDDKRSRIVIDDAKTFFASAGQQFDVIVSEPSNPWVSGVATLFSDEFYRRVTDYLAPDGMLVQWLQIYETDMSVVVSILKALSPHFDDYHIYNVDDSNILIVARRRGTVPDPSPDALGSSDLQRELHRAGIVGVEDLLSRRIGNKALLDPFISGYPVPVNSDYFPYVDQNAERFRFTNRDAIQLPELTMLPVPFIQLALPEWSQRPLEHAPDFPEGRRETLANQAGLIAASVRVNRFNLLPGEITALIAALDMPAEACRVRGAADAWETAVTNLSKRTTPFLPNEELAPIWDKILSSPCYVSSLADRARWPDFLHAVALRDRPEIADLGRRLLAERSTLGSARLGYVLSATSAALYGSGHRREAAQLIGKWVSRVPPNGEYDLALGILAAAGTG
jgi:spermidine synthase